MRKFLLAAMLFSLCITASSQSFNTGEILKPGRFAAGINPVLENNSTGIYLHGGYGLKKQIDLGFRYGFFNGNDYIGADLEWGLRKTPRMNLSLVTGVHKSFDLGLDLGLVASFPLNPYIEIISGLDSDFNFSFNSDFFLWLPFGVEISLHKKISLILEADIPLVEYTPGIIGGGLVIYL
jgi:hypothetical protein